LIVHHDIGTGAMQHAGDLGADATRATGDQRDLAGKRLVRSDGGLQGGVEAHRDRIMTETREMTQNPANAVTAATPLPVAPILGAPMR